MGNHRSDYRCPNPECPNHVSPVAGKPWFIKKGYYKTKHNGQPVPRYQCRCCGKKFSSHTFSDTIGQHRPDVNEIIYREYCSNLSLNRLAKNLKINRKTVVRKFHWLAQKARRVHEATIAKGRLKSSLVQFDEMETFEHTRRKPLSIALAVRVLYSAKDKAYRSFEIIDAKVAVMPAWGLNKALSEAKYGPREDHRPEAIRKVLGTVSRCAARGGLKIQVDRKSQYPSLIQEMVPGAEVKKTSRAESCGSGFDPMFCLNHTCARIRHDLSRMARKSWVTTKKPAGLQAHLDLFMAYMNGYQLC